MTVEAQVVRALAEVLADRPDVVDDLVAEAMSRPDPLSSVLPQAAATASAFAAIYRFDLTTHLVRRLGTLRHPVTHGNAATLGSTVYLVGGRGDLVNAQTSDIWAINPATGRVTAAGRLPTATSDAAVATVGNGIIVAGGLSPTTVLDGVGELVPAGTG